MARDDSNLSKGYGFVSFSNFEASDEAIANMNGQYLMNKEISVQYAYKKDGKGERHGDEAERMLAAQARKHNVQPTSQPIPVGLFTGTALNGPVGTLDGDPARSGSLSQANPNAFVPNRMTIPNGNYPNVVPPPQQRPATSQPLQAPPTGLPARPPPSQAGYGGPQGFLPPGFNNAAPQAFPPNSLPPAGFGPPPGFNPLLGQNPPGLQPGFQSSNYGRIG